MEEKEGPVHTICSCTTLTISLSQAGFVSQAWLVSLAIVYRRSAWYNIRIRVTYSEYPTVSVRKRISQNLNNIGTCTCSEYQAFLSPLPSEGLGARLIILGVLLLHTGAASKASSLLVIDIIKLLSPLVPCGMSHMIGSIEQFQSMDIIMIWLIHVCIQEMHHNGENWERVEERHKLN